MLTTWPPLPQSKWFFFFRGFSLLYIPILYIDVHSFRIYCTYIAHILIIHCAYIAHTLCIHCPYIVHTLHIHCAYIAHTLLIHCSYIAHTLRIHCTYIFVDTGALLFVLGHVLDLALLLLNRGALILVGRLRHCPALLLVHGLALLLLKGNKSKLV